MPHPTERVWPTRGRRVGGRIPEEDPFHHPPPPPPRLRKRGHSLVPHGVCRHTVVVVLRLLLPSVRTMAPCRCCNGCTSNTAVTRRFLVCASASIRRYGSPIPHRTSPPPPPHPFLLLLLLVVVVVVRFVQFLFVVRTHGRRKQGRGGAPGGMSFLLLLLRRRRLLPPLLLALRRRRAHYNACYGGGMPTRTLVHMEGTCFPMPNVWSHCCGLWTHR